ncbi:MAG: hypothetical protein ACO1RT_15050 [Planctomycetaceae bacterium]
MRHAIRALAMCLSLLAAGCNEVTISEPVGTPLEDHERGMLVGRWLGAEEQVIDIRVAPDGQLFVGWMEWEETTRTFKAHTAAIEIRRAGSLVYLFLRTEAPYGLARLEIVSASELRMYSASPSAFRDAVRSGIVAGEVLDKPDGHFKVQIDGNAKLTRDALSSANNASLFPDDGCQVLRKLSSRS